MPVRGPSGFRARNVNLKAHFLIALVLAACTLIGCKEEEAQPVDTDALVKEMKSNPDEAIPEKDKINDAIMMGTK